MPNDVYACIGIDTNDTASDIAKALPVALIVTYVVPPTTVGIPAPPPPPPPPPPETGGTETDPPPGHHDCTVGHVGPGLPSVTPLAGEGATFDGPMADSSLPLNAERANAKFHTPGKRKYSSLQVDSVTLAITLQLLPAWLIFFDQSW